jgi:hypothetical protein
MTVIDYGDGKVVLGVMTGGPPPANMTNETIDGVIARTLECEVTDGEARFVTTSDIM